MAFHWSDAEFTLWSFISHLMLAIVIVSGINLVFMLFGQNREATIAPARRSLCAGALLALVCVVRFLENALSFAGWAANVYAGTLAVALTLYGFLIVRPSDGIVAWIVLAASAALAGSGESLLASSAG